MDGADIYYDGEKTGLKFSVSISKAEYDFISFSGAETGVVIATKYYDDTVSINQSSLFGDDATYDFATYSNGDWSYDNNGKIRVVNINANDWVKDGDRYVYSGAIVDILDKNITTVFVGVGYLQLDGEYLFTSKYTSSIFDLVKGLDSTPDYIPKTWLNEIRPTSYTVKFLLTSVVGNNNVLCTYKGQNDVADVTVLYGDTLANLGKAIPHAKYSDDYVFDRWIYIDNKGNQHTITSTTIFNEEIFMGSAVTVIAQCKPSPYGPTIS